MAINTEVEPKLLIDAASPNSDAADQKPRARQNVVFELGFFISALGPERVTPLVAGDIEQPSDFEGVVYISLDRDDWRRTLARELLAAGYKFDASRAL